MRSRSGALPLALALACGPSSSSSTGDTGDTGSGSGSGSGDPSTTADDTGEPVCEPRTNATLDWQRNGSDDALPSAGRDVAVAVDEAGRIVVAVTDETEDDADILVSQLDPAGTVQWTVRYEGPAGLHDQVLGLAVDREGFTYVAVSEQARELISEGFGDIAERNVVILAIDPSGGKRWRFVREIAPGPYNDNARVADIAIAPSGEVLVVDADAMGFGTPPSLLRLDRWGNELLRTDLAFEATGLWNVRIAIAGDDAIWVASATYGESRILRMDTAGAIAWEDIRPVDDTLVTAVAAGLGGEAYLLRTHGDAEAGDAGFALVRYEGDGTVAWTKTLTFSTGDGYPAGIAIDCDGSPIVATELQDDPSRTASVLAFTTAGDPTWSAELGETGNAGPRSIARGHDGAFVLGGISGSSAALQPWLARVR